MFYFRCEGEEWSFNHTLPEAAQGPEPAEQVCGRGKRYYTQL